MITLFRSCPSDSPGKGRLSLCLLWAVSGRETAHSVSRNAADSPKNRTKTAFPSTYRLLAVWTFKYEHSSSVNMLSLSLRRRQCAEWDKTVAKTTAYSRFLV